MVRNQGLNSPLESRTEQTEQTSVLFRVLTERV